MFTAVSDLPTVPDFSGILLLVPAFQRSHLADCTWPLTFKFAAHSRHWQLRWQIDSEWDCSLLLQVALVAIHSWLKVSGEASRCGSGLSAPKSKKGKRMSKWKEEWNMKGSKRGGPSFCSLRPQLLELLGDYKDIFPSRQSSSLIITRSTMAPTE